MFFKVDDVDDESSGNGVGKGRFGPRSWLRDGAPADGRVISNSKSKSPLALDVFDLTIC